MQSMRVPWLHRDHTLQSALSFAELQGIRLAVNARPFTESVTGTLRDALGDWRGIALPEPPKTSPR